MTIRNVKEGDWGKIFNFAEEFEVAKSFLENLRVSSSYINDLSFVIEDGLEIVGFMMLTRNKLGKVEGLTLAPLLVEKRYQHKGLGKHLLRRGLNVASALGYEYIVALGNDAFYEKYNFLPAENFGVVGTGVILSLNHMDEELNCEIKYPRAIKNLFK